VTSIKTSEHSVVAAVISACLSTAVRVHVCV